MSGELTVVDAAVIINAVGVHSFLYCSQRVHDNRELQLYMT
jgi:hypothetical protein